MSTGSPDPAPGGFNFLFRTDRGIIDRATWWRGTLGLAVVLGVLSAIWGLLAPYANREVEAGQPLFEPMAFVAYAYLLVFAFAIILIAVCHYNLSAKRWRDRGRPAALAGLLPFVVLLAAAAHWLQPRIAEVMPAFTLAFFDVTLLAVIIWNVVELGTLDRPAH